MHAATAMHAATSASSTTACRGSSIGGATSAAAMGASETMAGAPADVLGLLVAARLEQYWGAFEKSGYDDLRYLLDLAHSASFKEDLAQLSRRAPASRSKPASVLSNRRLAASGLAAADVRA